MSLSRHVAGVYLLGGVGAVGGGGQGAGEGGGGGVHWPMSLQQPEAGLQYVLQCLVLKATETGGSFISVAKCYYRKAALLFLKCPCFP